NEPLIEGKIMFFPKSMNGMVDFPSYRDQWEVASRFYSGVVLEERCRRGNSKRDEGAVFNDPF
ncbi:hypothetical protein AKJ45_03505, partial [candidate division MSBL1 archaeon SCGC-AAA261F19]